MVGKIPLGWEWVKLGKVCKLKNGFAFKSTEYRESGIPVIRISDIKAGVVDTKKAVGVFPEPKFDDFLVEKGNILIAMSGATTGKFGIFKSDEKAYQNQRVGRFKINDPLILDNSFLLYQLHSLQRQIEKDAYGGAQPNISSTKIEEMFICLPNLPTQKSIVSKIEELFSELDKGIENLKIAQEQLKVYRQSVLKWAFEGRLTDENVKDGELPTGWIYKKLSDICHKIQDGSHFSPQVQYDEPGESRFKYITAKNIRNNYMDFRKITYVNKEYHESIYNRCNPEFGDVLLTKDGINTGEVTLNTLHEPFSLLSSVCIFKTKKEALNSEFLKYYIQSPYGSKAILQSMTGTAIKRIVLRKIKDSEIILPPLLEQKKVVQEIESRLSVINKMDETLKQSSLQVESLRQSILKRAFEGKLI